MARRLERAEALSNARFVEARASVTPASAACWIEAAGAHAMFDGPSSPATQTFGLGMFQAPAAADLDRIEAFFTERGAPIFHEVSPLADAGVVPLLTSRGYHPLEFTSVLYQPIDAAGLNARPAPGIAVRQVGPDDAEVYARTSAGGWSESGFGDFVLEMARVTLASRGSALFLAELDGAPIATAALNLVDGVAHFAGASTIPAGRNRGAQLALLDHRLRYAAAHGCDIALMGALPGSGSQRNAERNGFRIAYTRIKWSRT